MALPVTWQVRVDWDGDGSFTGPYDDVSADLVELELSAGRSGATDGFGPAEAVVTLDNAELRYSRYNTSSPIYGLMLPGRAVEIRATHNAVTYERFQGELYEPEESGYAADGLPTVTFRFVDGTERLRRQRVRLALSEDAGADTVIGDILDAAGWPAGRRNLDAALSPLTAHWGFDESAGDAAREVARNDVGGAWYQDREGDLRFENRDARGTSAVYATISSAASVTLGSRFEDLIESVRGTRAGLIADADATALFVLQPQGYRLRPGLNTIVGRFGDTGGKDVTAPVVGTDIHANGAQDGSGTSKDAQLVVDSFTAYGNGFVLVLENLDSADVYLWGSPALQVMGRSVSRSNDARLVEAAASSPLVAGQVLELDEYRWQDDDDAIAGYVAYLAEVMSQDMPRAEVELLVHTDAEVAVALGIDVSKRVTMALPTSAIPPGPGLVGDYVVEAYELRAAPDEDIECTVTLWSATHALATGFRVSGAAGGGLDYSAISGASPAVTEPRIWF